jgi:23S rRNA pseudouridine2605 synthase
VCSAFRPAIGAHSIVASMSPSRRDLDYLPRVLSKWGHCSRKEAERLVIAGRVTVNGVVRRHVLDEVHPKRDAIAVDGAPVRPAMHLHLKMHKPLGVVTTMSDPEGRPTVASLIPEKWKGAMPVGRLDQDSTGLLLLTNDHDLGHRIAGPNHRVKKRYLVEVNQHPDDSLFAPIRAGIEIDGERCRPAEVTILERLERSTRLEIVLDEGKFRQIRRSLKSIGLRVRSLHRTRIGPIELGDLEPGAVVELTAAELAALRATAKPA